MKCLWRTYGTLTVLIGIFLNISSKSQALQVQSRNVNVRLPCESSHRDDSFKTATFSILGNAVCIVAMNVTFWNMSAKLILWEFSPRIQVLKGLLRHIWQKKPPFIKNILSFFKNPIEIKRFSFLFYIQNLELCKHNIILSSFPKYCKLDCKKKSVKYTSGDSHKMHVRQVCVIELCGWRKWWTE